MSKQMTMFEPPRRGLMAPVAVTQQREIPGAETPMRFSGPPDSVSEERRRIEIDRKQPGGTVCRCCDQHTQEYRRKFNSGMARSLIALYRHHIKRQIAANDDFPWMYYRGLVQQNLEYSKLQFWQLIEIKPHEDDPAKRTSGVWRLTHLAPPFVQCLTTLPKYAIFTTGKCSD